MIYFPLIRYQLHLLLHACRDPLGSLFSSVTGIFSFICYELQEGLFSIYRICVLIWISQHECIYLGVLLIYLP